MNTYKGYAIIRSLFDDFLRVTKDGYLITTVTTEVEARTAIDLITERG